MNNNQNKNLFLELFRKVFNKSNLNKILIIFVVGFISRIFINYIYNINVFVDYFNKISIMYYVSMSMFIVLIHEIITYFDINVIPSYILNFVNNIPKLVHNLSEHIIKSFYNIKNIIYINNKILGNFKWDDLSIFSIKNLLKDSSLSKFSQKLPINEIEPCNKPKENLSTLNSNTLSRSSGESSRNNYKNNNGNNSHRESRTNRINTYSNIDSRERNQNNVATPSYQNNSSINNTPRYDDYYFNVETVRNSEGESLPVRTPDSYTYERNYDESIYTTPQTPIVYQTTDTTYPTMPYTPNPYANLSTPSTTAPTFRSHESVSTVNLSNNTPKETINKTNVSPPKSLKDRPFLNAAYRPFDRSTGYIANNNGNQPNIENTYNEYYYNEAGPSYDSYPISGTTYLPATTYVPETTYLPATTYVPTSYVPSYVQPSVPVTYSTIPNSYELPIRSSNSVNPNNISNPRPSVTYVDSNSVDWTDIRNKAQNNIREELRKYSSKEVVIAAKEEIIVPKKGVLGKVKVGFKYLDKKRLDIDSVYVSFRDKSRRKFIWTLWEKNSGLYESYQDFKDSWNPNTSIWSEIKNRTRKDMRMDIENMLGVNKNTKTLGNTTMKNIKPSSYKTTGEVRNLMTRSDPFKNRVNNNLLNSESSNTKNNVRTNHTNTTEDIQSENKHRHKRKHSNSKSNHSHRHNHSNSRHGNSTHSHGNSSRSHGNSSRSHAHSKNSHSNRRYHERHRDIDD